MSHSYSQNHIHLVFSTKDREKLVPKTLQAPLWAYMAGICKSNDMLAFAIGGMEDHVHTLFRLPPTMTLARAVNLLKANSSSWMSEHLSTLFGWQKGYGAFSVSSSNVSEVVKYIDKQEMHHRKRTFEEEYLALLKKHGVPFDPKYVFG
jgi:REP element-mobilizing transposase RayT